MEVAAPSNVPTGADAEANKELASAWRDMEEKMHELASLSHGKNYDENLTADNVRENLQAIQNRKKSEKMDKVKRVFNDSLQVIGVVGGMVAEAASQVFAPAGQCYNALNFVIAAYQGYQRAFESLDSVFAACNDFLNRLTDYVQANMSKNMSMICCDVLRHFVYVCERAIRLRSSALFKVTTYAKIAFLSKDEFSDMLSTMDGLANRELLQSTADTYLNAKEAADNSKIARELLEGDRSEKADEKKERKDKATLVKILAFDQGASTWDSHAEAPIASWGSTYQNIRLNTVADTGNWLFKTNAFRAWAKKKSDTPVLAVVGGEASGKSFLAANAISHLRAHGSGEEMDSRHLVGFFFLNEKKANAGINALGKSIIWQFANSDASYMQSVALTAEEDGQIDPKDILTKLLLHNHKALESIDATFYIVINKLGDEKENVHDGVVDFLKNASLSSNKSVRILFTATQGTVDKLNKRGLSFPALSMSENTDDIRKYVDTHMDRVGVLSRKEDDQVVKLRNEILKTLPQKTKRNYYMIDNFLERISSMDLDKDILKALDEAGGDLSLRIGADVQRLNQIRTAEELGEINTIIIWITFAMERMTVEKMQAVLQFRNEAVSLVPLEERLRKKFLLFEIDNDGCVDFRSEKIPPALRVRASTTKDEEKSGDKVNKGEVDILKHFLGTVCPPDLVNKLQLHQHFDSKLKPQQEQIFREDENTAHFHLAKTCLGVLVDEDAVSLKVLRGYAARHLMDHMSEVNLTLIDSELKKGIGNNLVRLFRFGPAIDNLFWAKRPQPAYPEWIFDQDAMKVITNWLKHTSPDLENDTKAEAWMKGVLDGHIPLQALLEPSVLRMAEYVFQKFESKEVTYAAFQIVELFVSEIDPIPRPASGHKEKAPPMTQRIEDWCQEKLQVKDKTSFWHFQMATIFHHRGEISNATDRCRQAIHMDKKNWRAGLLLAELTDSKKESKDILKKLVGRYEGNASWMEKHPGSFGEMTYNLGNIYWEGERFDDAIAWYNKCLLHPDPQYAIPFKILSRFSSSQKFQEIIDAVNVIQKENYLTPMMTTLEYLAGEKNMNTFLLDAALDRGMFNSFPVIYQNATQAAIKAKDFPVSFNLQHSYASALSALPGTSTETVRELLEGAARDVPYTGLDPAAAFFIVGYRLGTIYLGNAKRAKDDGNEEDANKWLRRMSEVVPEQVPEDQMRLPLRLFSARYYVVYKDLKAARKAVHNTLKLAIELLSDKDDSNDMFAYTKILFTVIPFKDVDNAATALALMKLESPNQAFSLPCSCGCGATWDAPGDMYWCMDCIKVLLTPKCKDAVKAPNTVNKVCHQSHDHLYIPPWDAKKMSAVPKDQVPYKGNVITMKKWKGILGDDYKLSK